METWKNRDKFHTSLGNPQHVDHGLDPINSLLRYNPMAANPYDAIFRQEAMAPQSFPSPEEQLSADISGSKKSLKAGEFADGESSRRRNTKKPERGPICVFKTRSQSEIVEDGYKWRKYGTKMLKSRAHPRSYYRCVESHCSVKKRVEREATDPGLLITTYEGTHNHESPSVIYYIGKPIILPQLPGSKPAIVLVNADVAACSEAGIEFASQ